MAAGNPAEIWQKAAGVARMGGDISNVDAAQMEELSRQNALAALGLSPAASEGDIKRGLRVLQQSCCRMWVSVWF